MAKSKAALALCLIPIVAMVFVWGVFGTVVLEKVITALAMPLGLAWCLTTAATAIAWLRRERFAFIALFITSLLIYVVGNGLIARTGVRFLEREFLGFDSSSESYDAIVLLGGSTSTRPNGEAQVSLGGDRVMTALRLYQSQRTRRIVCTGSKIAGLDRDGLEQSEAAKLILVSAGVPAESVERIGGRNTSEEMKTLGTMFDSSKRVGLITSAWHMRRALRLARSQGFDPLPIPADFRSPPSMAPNIMDFVPTGDSAYLMQLVTKEFLARLVGR